MSWISNLENSKNFQFGKKANVPKFIISKISKFLNFDNLENYQNSKIF